MPNASLDDRPPSPPRVLIVEDDPVLAMALHDECVDAGLEPKLCSGARRSSGCPELAGDPCPRAASADATFVAVTDGRQRMATPACAASALVVAGERPLLGSASLAVLQPDASFDYPYDPADVAAALAALVRDDGCRSVT